MEQLNFSYQFSDIKPISELVLLPVGDYICIIYDDIIPPYLGLIIDQKFFSLKKKGKDVDVPIDKLEHIFSLKEVSTVFVKVVSSLRFSEICDYFTQVLDGQAKGQTCLDPSKS